MLIGFNIRWTVTGIIQSTFAWIEDFIDKPCVGGSGGYFGF
jgi:hypothetical protein